MIKITAGALAARCIIIVAMKQSEIKKKFKEMGFDLVCVSKEVYMFNFEDIKMLYLTDSKDSECLRLAIPCVYEITTENKDLMAEIINEANLKIKYAKALVISDQVWINYEYFMPENANLELVITHCLMVLFAMKRMFFGLIEGDDVNAKNRGEKMNESYKLVKEVIDNLGYKVEEDDGDTITVKFQLCTIHICPGKECDGFINMFLANYEDVTTENQIELLEKCNLLTSKVKQVKFYLYQDVVLISSEFYFQRKSDLKFQLKTALRQLAGARAVYYETRF